MVAPGNACSTARSPRPRARNVRRTGLRITADAGDKYEAGLIAHVGTEDRNPVQARRSQRAARSVGMSDRNAHSRSPGSEALHEAPTEEAGAAKHADRGHDIPFGMLNKIDPSTAFHDARRSWSKCLIRIVCDPSENSQHRTRVRWPHSKPSSFVEIIGSLSGRNSS